MGDEVSGQNFTSSVEVRMGGIVGLLSAMFHSSEVPLPCCELEWSRGTPAKGAYLRFFSLFLS